MRGEIWTVGHSILGLTAFIKLLKKWQIQAIADVRRFPISAKVPWTRRERLARSLSRAGIDYVWFGERLGGYRRPDYRAWTRTKEFKLGLIELLNLAERKRTALLCAEALWFRCHRSYIADRLVRLGWAVHHIIDEKRIYEHRQR